ncbi:LOW QUALITY PROTEIN: hypothetical protein PHMEG_00032533 [Phytophthora megakarya]|uniref:Uncharacterized protein n=1 Tax=Phytophthora megakarya TaxID=4795 RepID=A0A225UVR4_9STRA|nr:LOW QUALITY PROTEIN: hypothetical protein PHMEG_00032533 [Phytophthora megakarya]
MACLIQETHVGSTDEADEVEMQWKRLWGNQHVVNGPRFRTDDNRAGGVAILVNPEVAKSAEPCLEHEWSKTTIMLSMGETYL